MYLNKLMIKISIKSFFILLWESIMGKLKLIITFVIAECPKSHKYGSVSPKHTKCYFNELDYKMSYQIRVAI